MHGRARQHGDEGSFQEIPHRRDFANANPEQLQEAIKSTGFFRNKTKSLIGMGKALVERHGGEVPRTMEELTKVQARDGRRRMSCWERLRLE